jgi:acid stress-induced BolA-like protein IbaG/YrbA
MSSRLQVVPGEAPPDIPAAIRHAVEAAIPDCKVSVEGGRGHFTIEAVSPAFAGKNRVQQQRMVLSAIKHLMDGAAAPVHAVDRVTTRVP